MNLDKKVLYTAPKAEMFNLESLSFLEYFSGNGDIGQWEGDYDDLGDTEDYVN